MCRGSFSKRDEEYINLKLKHYLNRIYPTFNKVETPFWEEKLSGTYICEIHKKLVSS